MLLAFPPISSTLIEINTISFVPEFTSFEHCIEKCTTLNWLKRKTLVLIQRVCLKYVHIKYNEISKEFVSHPPFDIAVAGPNYRILEVYTGHVDKCIYVENMKEDMRLSVYICVQSGCQSQFEAVKIS